VDLNLYFRVLWRFRVVVAVGIFLAIALSFMSFARVSLAHGSPSVSYRQQPTFQAATRLLVTQEGFPWGRSVLPITTGTTPQTPGSSTPSGLQFADPNRFATLALLYAQLLNGNAIQDRIRKSIPVGDFLTAEPVMNAQTNSVLPFVDVIGVAHTAAEAARTSRIGADLFRSYIAQQQTSAAIRPNERVLLPVVSTKATLLAGRKKTLPIVAFLTVMIATIGLAFILENMRPRVRGVPRTLQPPASFSVSERRSASELR